LNDARPRALAVIDGEHYPDVVRDALAELPYEFIAAVLVGGAEKLRDGHGYGVELAPDIDEAIDRHRPDVVVDLSDEPVLGPLERFALASRVLAEGIPYIGADFRFDPPELEAFPAPSLSVIGTGKRVGKTAVTGHLAGLASADRRVVVVAMGRGGPAEPETITAPPTIDTLLELSRSGRHAASDHLETAALTGVPTVGCRRCGGGFAGAAFTSNVAAGARRALELEPDVVVFDGSGAALPPVAADRTIVVVGAHQDAAVVGGYLNRYRLLLADLVLVNLAEPPSGGAVVRDAIRSVIGGDVAVVPTVLRPRPTAAVRGRSVAYFCTAPDAVHAVLAAHLEEQHGLDVRHVSGSLANRETLRAELEHVDADVYLVELKAAAIDVVAESAAARGAEIVPVANDVIALDRDVDLDEMLLEMARIT
jgi:cyclic 2,3-diphosphoglycerate synthetase